MERKKIKILSNKNQDQQPTPDPKPTSESKETTSTSTPKSESTPKSDPKPKKKLSTAEKIKQAKLARKSKKSEDDGKKKTSSTEKTVSIAPKKKKKRRKSAGSGWLKKITPLFLLLGLGYVAYLLIFWDTDTPTTPPPDKNNPTVSVPDQANLLYGLDKTQYDTEERVVQETQPLEQFLSQWRFPRDVSRKLATDMSSYMRPATIKRSQFYTLFFEKGEVDKPVYLVYEPDNYSYITFNLQSGSLGAKRTKRNVKSTPKSFAGTIQTNISELHSRKKLNYQLLPQLEEALAWSIDFYHLKPGAKYKMVYDEIYADGESVGSKLHALEFKTDKETIKAFYYKDGFFDGRSRPMKRAFLKSPVEYARISSKFDLNRKHPVLGKVKPHLGTDYAAPEGTPIRAISDGVITVATFKKNNGNYVKMKHDKTYDSQYLHMSKIMDGIKPGVRVKQGQTIGFVGSTGLATGPHVCFRFWKRGKQIDFVNERLPDSRPIPGNQTVPFIAHRDSLIAKLREIN